MQIAYIIYLAASGDQIQTVSIILIVAVYGLQALVFVLRRKWDMIGWMVFYILAIPIMSLAIPLYSFWRMDDFSWGQTRIVLGEAGKKLIVHDEGKFDPRSIPLKSWNEYVCLSPLRSLKTRILTCTAGKRALGQGEQP